MRRGLLAALLTLLLVPAPASAGITGFKTPSGHIFCAYLSFDDYRALRCDISNMTNEPKPAPEWCEYDYGSYFGMSPTGKGRRLCVSDTPMDPAFKTLAYGSTWKRGAYTCRSRRANLRCTNARGHGFQISRSKQTLF